MMENRTHSSRNMLQEAKKRNTSTAFQRKETNTSPDILLAACQKHI